MSKESNDRPRNRRAFLGALGLGAVGAAFGALGRTESAGAATGAPLTLGTENTAADPTRISATGTIGGEGAFVVDGQGVADYGIRAAGKNIGLYGQGPIGVYGDGAVGGVFGGSDAAISLQPRATAGPPSGKSLKGDIALDANAVLWLCVADGEPGTWVRLSDVGTRMLPRPERAYSSTDDGAGGKLARNEVRTVEIRGRVPGVPGRATAIIGNVTVHQTEGGGYVTAYPSGTARPGTSTINWGAPGQSIANGVTVALGDDGAINLYADVTPGDSATHVIVDIVGYIV